MLILLYRPQLGKQEGIWYTLSTGLVAQLVSALRSHRKGRLFESDRAHQNLTLQKLVELAEEVEDFS